jgi:hypothetical protein
MAVAEGKTPKKEPAVAVIKIEPDGTVRVTRPGVLRLDLVGTAEAADDILHVERPRIGRWRKNGVMPKPLAVIAAGPVWERGQIEQMVGEREKRRRAPAGTTR